MELQSMTLVFEYTCKFIFPTWYSQSVGMFILGLFITLAVSILTASILPIKKKLSARMFGGSGSAKEKGSLIESLNLEDVAKEVKTSQSVYQKIFSIAMTTLYAFLHTLLMVLIMSMNFYVILTVIIGFTAAHAFHYEKPKQKESVCHSKKCKELQSQEG